MQPDLVDTHALDRLRHHVRYLAFDLDGTVTDSAGAIAANYQETFRQFGLAPPEAATIVRLIGLPLDEVLRSLIPGGEHLPDAEIATWMQRYRAIYPDIALPHTTLFPGVVQTLRSCIAAGYRCSLATSKQRAAAGEILAYCGIADLFTEVAGGDVAARPKPFPDMLVWLMDRLGCAPGELLMVGDTSFDLDMGRAAGAFTCGVSYGVHGTATLMNCRPDALIDRFDGLLGLLGLA